METAIHVLRYVHITVGYAALFVAGPAAMLTRKGGVAHRRWGRVFAIAMTVASITAFIVAAWRPNHFLLLMAVFSLYLVVSGYRALGRRREVVEPSIVLDWLPALATLAVSLFLLKSGAPRRDAVMIVYGLIGLGLTGADLWRFTNPSPPARAWLIVHGTRMLAAYVAAVTSFSMAHLPHAWPQTLVFLWPTAVCLPLIAWWAPRASRQPSPCSGAERARHRVRGSNQSATSTISSISIAELPGN